MYKYFFFLALVCVSVGVFLVSSAEAKAAQSGDLIKCPDFSSVYYLADDDTRWVFPNEATFFLWYGNFDDVVEVSCEELASYSIGDVVTYRPGTRLVKIQSIDKVYAVEPGGVLRWIISESMADDLYGYNWASRIDDVPDGFWSSYTEGEPLAYGEYPAGTVLRSSTADIFVVGNDDSISGINEDSLPEVMDYYYAHVPGDEIAEMNDGPTDFILQSDFDAQHKIDVEVYVEELTPVQEISILEEDMSCANDLTCMILAANNCDYKSIAYTFDSDSYYFSLRPRGEESCTFHIEYIEGDSDEMEGLSRDYAFLISESGNMQSVLTGWYNGDFIFTYLDNMADYANVDAKYSY